MNGLSASDLRSAANYLRKTGWQRGDIGMHGGPRCALGSIYSAIEVRGDDPDEWYYSQLGAFNLAMYDRLGAVLTDWNDHPDRTAEEVVTMLDNLAFDEDLKAAAQSSPLPAESRHDAIIPSLEAVPVA